MAPEGHGAQVLPDPYFGPKRLHAHTKSEHPATFFIDFIPKCTAEAPEPNQAHLLIPLRPLGSG